jgi:hypothetical protein
MRFAALIAISLAGCGGIVEQALESEDADAIAPPEDDGGSPEVPGDAEVSEEADDAGRADEAEADAAEVVQPEDAVEPEDAGPEAEAEADDAGADDAQDDADSVEVLEDAPPAEDAPAEDEGSAPGCDLSADFEGSGTAPWTSWHSGISWDASGSPYAPGASGGAMMVSGWGAEHLSSSRVLAFVASVWIFVPADDPSVRTRVTTPCGARVAEWLGGEDWSRVGTERWPSDEWVLCEREQRCEAGALTTIARVNGVEAWRDVAPLSDCSLLPEVRQLAGLSPRVQDGDYLPRTVVGPVHADDYCFRAL